MLLIQTYPISIHKVLPLNLFISASNASNNINVSSNFKKFKRKLVCCCFLIRIGGKKRKKKIKDLPAGS